MLRVRTAQGVLVGVAAHYDVDVAALLEVRIEDRFAGRAPAPPGYLGESGVVH
jgi:hypothetical protein